MTDCFARGILGCSILIDGNCESCSFRKSKEEFNKAEKRVYERLRGLSVEQQLYIAGKYYKGKTVWGDQKNAI